MVKLFGFELNQTSGVLLFIFGLLTILTGTILLYSSFTTWNLTGAVPPAGLIISIVVIGFGFFIVIVAGMTRPKSGRKKK